MKCMKIGSMRRSGVNRLLLLVVLALSVLCRPAAASAVWQEPAVERQEIAVTLVPSDHLLIGESTITFAAGTRRVKLRLSPTASIESVSISGAAIPFTFVDGDSLPWIFPKRPDTGRSR